MRAGDPMQLAFARLADFLFRRRRAVLAASAVALALTAFAATRLRLSSDWVEPFLPRSDAALGSYASALHRFGDTEMVYADVKAPDAESVHAAADLVEARMRRSALFTRVLGRLTAEDLRLTAEAVGSAAPLLLDADGLRELDERTRPDAIAARMDEHYERLLGPGGGLFQDSFERDPLDVTPMALGRTERAGAASDARVERGRILSADGRHALVVGVASANVGDEAAGAAIEDLFAKLATDVARAPGGAELVWIGGHRHYRVNAGTMKRDVARVTILAVVLVLAVIVAGFRGARITWISAAAVVVGSVTGAAALATLYGECSGIALGFGAVLSGISVDYVIHLHAARRRGETREDAVRRVFAATGPSVAIAGVTSAAGFLVLLLSDVPALGQVGVAAGAAIVGALAFAFLPGPLVAASGRRDAPAAQDDAPNAFDRCATWMFGCILRRPRAAFACGGVLVVLGAAALPFLRFDPDIRRFQVGSGPAADAQTAVADTWGDLFTRQLIVVPGPDVQTVLARTDTLVDALRPLAGTGFSAIASTADVLPAISTQERRSEAWRAYWTPEVRARVRAGLLGAAVPYSIRASAFDPFFASLDSPHAPLTPERLAGTPLETILDRHLSVRPGDVLGLVVVSGSATDEGGRSPPAWEERVRSAAPDARILSGRGLADAVVGATRHEFAKLVLPALALVWLLLLAYYRGPVLACIGVFPLVGGLAVAAGLLVAFGEQVNLLNAAVALPVFGLGVDYSVFLVDAMRDVARDPSIGAADRAAAVGMRMGTMIGDVLTTLVGSAAMLFAATPAISSIGFAMTAGVGGAAAVAWLMVPQVVLGTGAVRR